MTDNKTTEKFLLDRVEDMHPKFLEAIKEASPLAVLGSLCIAISGFTGNNFPEAQPFAVTSATLFLFAFVASLTFRMLPKNRYSPIFPLLTYVISALGIMMLFGVLYYFVKQMPLASDTLAAVFPLTVVIVCTIAIVAIWGFRAKIHSYGRVPFYFEVISFLVIISSAIWGCFGGLNALNAFFHLSENYLAFSILVNNQIIYGIGYFFTFSITFFAIAYKNLMRGKKKVNLVLDRDEDEYVGCRY